MDRAISCRAARFAGTKARLGRHRLPRLAQRRQCRRSRVSRLQSKCSIRRPSGKTAKGAQPRASSLDQMDGGGAGCRVKVVGQVERVDGRSLTYAEFVNRFMKPNLPVVLTGLTSSWRSCEDWTLPDLNNGRRPNLEFFAQSFPSPLVQVATSHPPLRWLVTLARRIVL